MSTLKRLSIEHPKEKIMADELNNQDVGQIEVAPQEAVQPQETGSVDNTAQAPLENNQQQSVDWESRYKDEQRYINELKSQIAQEQQERDALSQKVNGMGQAIAQSLGIAPAQQEQVNPYELLPQFQSEMEGLKQQNQLLGRAVGKMYATGQKQAFESDTLSKHFGDNQEIKSQVMNELNQMYSSVDANGNQIGLDQLIEQGNLTYDSCFNQWLGSQVNREDSKILDTLVEIKQKRAAAASQNYVNGAGSIPGAGVPQQNRYSPISIEEAID